jgi:hypothetical protein
MIANAYEWGPELTAARFSRPKLASQFFLVILFRLGYSPHTVVTR